MFVNRLTVDGTDYFLPDPATVIRDAILSAVRAGGGYVNLPSPRSVFGTDILFSPGIAVLWNRIEILEEPDGRGNDVPVEFTDY